MRKGATPPLRVLIVEDDRADVIWISDALKESGHVLEVDVVRDGEQAVNYLDEAMRGEREMPHLMMLDLNLPRVSGFEVAQHTQDNAGCAGIFVCVLTTSYMQIDIDKAWKAGAHAYLQKPPEEAHLNSLAKKLLDFLEDEFSHLPKREGT